MPGEKAGRLLRMLEAVAMGHGGTTFEVSLPVANGRPRTILWTATDCRDAGGKVKQVVCAGIDVTADQKIRRVAEERQVAPLVPERRVEKRTDVDARDPALVLARNQRRQASGGEASWRPQTVLNWPWFAPWM